MSKLWLQGEAGKLVAQQTQRPLCHGGDIDITEEERQRRSEAMRALNREGRNGRRRPKSDDEIRRKSLMDVIANGTARQKLDACKALEALDAKVAAAGPVRKDFESMSEEEIEAHLEGMVVRVAEAWYADRVLPDLRKLFVRFGVEHVFDDVLERSAAWVESARWR